MTVDSETRLVAKHVAVAAAVGLSLRLVHLFWLYFADPALLDPVVDAQAYHEWALRLLEDPIGDEVFFQSPGYAYLVAALYAIFGAQWIAVGAVQALLGAVSAVLAAAVTRQIVPKSHWAPVAAAWLMALYQPLIFYDALLLKVELTNVLLLAFAWLYVRGLASWGIALFAGLALGFLGLVRGNVYLAVPLLIVWIPIAGRWLASSVPASPWRQIGFRTAAFVVGFGAVLVLVGVRNQLVADQFVVSSAGGGGTLYLGNNPYSPLGDYDHMPWVRTNPEFEEEDWRAEASRRAGRALTTAEAGQYWRDEAVRYTMADPGAAVRRAWHKLGLVVQSYELGDNYSLRFHGEFSPVLWVRLPWWTMILALAVAWAACSRRGGRRAVPLLILATTYLATLIVFFVRSRYRIPMVPLLIPLAAIELTVLVEVLRTDRRRAAIHTCVIALVAAISLALGVPKSTAENLGRWWSALGARHVERGDVEGGVGLMRSGLDMDPENPILWMNLGRVYIGQDRNEEAAAACSRSLELQPSRDDARECLAYALLSLGQPQAACDALAPALRSRMPVERFLLGAFTAEAAGHKADALRLLDQGIQEHGPEPRLVAQRTRIAATGTPARAP